MQNLIEETKALLKTENEIQARIIRNLQKLFDSRIHLEMGFTSFLAFCEKDLSSIRPSERLTILDVTARILPSSNAKSL